MRVFTPGRAALLGADTFVTWLADLALKIASVAREAMATLYSDVALSREPGEWGVCAVRVSRHTSERFITYHLREIIFDEGPGSFRPYVLAMPASVSAMLATCDNRLSTTQADERRDRVGPNVIQVHKPYALDVGASTAIRP